MDNDGLIERVGAIGKRAEGERKEERRFALSNSIAHYFFGAAGVIGGAVAAATASKGTTIPVVAGITAAVGSGLLTAFNFEDKARKRFAKERRYKSVVEHAETESALLSIGEHSDEEIEKAIASVQERLDDVRKPQQ